MAIRLPSCPIYYYFEADTSSCTPPQNCFNFHCEGSTYFGGNPEPREDPTNECFPNCCGASVSGVIEIPTDETFCDGPYIAYCYYAEAGKYGSIGGVELTPRPQGACWGYSFITESTQVASIYDPSSKTIKINYSVSNDTANCGAWFGFFYIGISPCG
jgi:hypothetical protein